MRKKIIAALSLLSLSLATLAFLAPRVVAADSVPFRWIEPAFVGEDPSLDYDTIVGYVEGTNWNFTMSWTNYYSYRINVSAIRVYFSWGKNYTYTYSPPISIDNGQTQLFTVYNVTPPVAETSELWRQSYYVYIHHVNSTTAPYSEVPMISPIYVHFGSDFAVLSADHLECLKMWAKLYGKISTDSVMLTQSTQYVSASSITAVQVLMEKAAMEFDLGLSILEAGVFGQAKTHFDNANSMYTEALNTWDTRGTAMEDAELNSTNAYTAYYNAQADAVKTAANASLVNAYGWLLFGLGWVFLGIGVIIYGMKRPKPPPAPTQ
jgi:hypothetical protein